MKTYTAREISSPANAAFREEIVQVIAHAFTEDSATRWLFSDHSRESFVADLPTYIGFIVRLSLLCDATFTIITQDELAPTTAPRAASSTTNEAQVPLASNSTVQGIAITIPPHGNATYDAATTALQAGLYALPFQCGWGLVWRLLTQYLRGMHRMHDEMFPDPSTKYHNWHLFYLAVHPNARGQGVGKRLLSAVQDTVRRFNQDQSREAEARGKPFTSYPLYLEASGAENKRLYNRVGFEDRSTMTYGKNLAAEENLKLDENGKVVGGRQFGMVWNPIPSL